MPLCRIAFPVPFTDLSEITTHITFKLTEFIRNLTRVPPQKTD